MIVANKKLSKNTLCIGSALILAVVLTSLLAIVGVMFLMVARVDRMATSAVSENRELGLAIDAVVATISQELALDVPFIDANGVERSEYHDYPDPCNAWLASLEPYESGGNYYWRHISDIYNKFKPQNLWDLQARIIYDYQKATFVNDSNIAALYPADADGDGVSDSAWVKLDSMNSGKGKPIYAAIRVIDNCGMLNINTAYEFNPFDPRVVDPNFYYMFDGSSQLQINLGGLARGGDVLDSINQARGLSAVPDDLELWGYEEGVIWRMEDPCAAYLSFDISDELILRNRYMVDQNDTVTRLKAVWPGTFDRKGAYGKNVPYTSDKDLPAWFDKAGNGDSPYYIPRHIATTCSMDRIINPRGPKFFNGKMVNVNNPTNNLAFKGLLHSAIMTGFLDADPNLAPIAADGLAAQIAANIIDFYDSDSQVTTTSDANGTMYYGFERPCIYISEVTACIASAPGGGIDRSYAVELHKPYFEDDDPASGRWELALDSDVIKINWTGSRRFHVIQMDAAALLTVPFNDPNEPADPFPIFGYSKGTPKVQDESGRTFSAGTIIQLRRLVGGVPIVVDSYTVPSSSPASGWLVTDRGAHSIQRDITRHKCIRRLWDVSSQADAPTLGQPNSFPDPLTDTVDPGMVQAHPYLDPAVYGTKGFKNIGEIGMVFARSGYNVFPGSTEADLRLDFQNLLFANLLNYLTVIDPATHPPLPWDEARIKGRINVNTAPPFVIGQLPWMNPAVATSVVAFRDSVAGGFGNIGQLTWVPQMGYYAFDGKDQQGFPDLTPLKLLGNADGSPDDFEERDLIFHRLSNLVTVRSDVFTAYILVRIGPDGPQKRVIAILDRSGVSPIDGYPYTTGRVKVRALHPVPDPW